MFDTQIEYFKNQYNIIAIDLLGHGQSTQVKKGESITSMSQWILEILEEENISKAHFLGVSLGSIIAQDFANRNPDLVQSLACFGGYDINNFDAKAQKENSMNQMLMMAKAIFSIKWFAESNKKISAYTPKAQQAFYEMNLEFPKKSLQYLSSLNNMINQHQTKSRSYPLIIGYGEHDIPMSKQLSQSWHEAEPLSQLVFFEEAGHCVNMDSPDKFNKVMETFWHQQHVI